MHAYAHATRGPLHKHLHRHPRPTLTLSFSSMTVRTAQAQVKLRSYVANRDAAPGARCIDRLERRLGRCFLTLRAAAEHPHDRLPALPDGARSPSFVRSHPRRTT